MSALKLTWRRSLAAVVVSPFLAWLPAQTNAAETSAERPSTAAAREESREGQPAAEGRRAENEFRELRQRAAAIERELRELGDTHPDRAGSLKKELTEIQQRMRQPRPGAGADEPQRVEIAVRQLQERISATERALQELGDGQAEKAESLKRELNAMREKMQQLRGQSAVSERERPASAVRELQKRAAVIELELQQLGDRHPDRGEALERELKGIRERMQQLRQHEGTADGKTPQGPIREMRERAAAIERELRELGTNHPDRAEALKRELTAIHEKAKQLYSAGGRPVPQPDNVPQRRAEESAGMSREIVELRNQVREMRQEMETLRAEVRKLLEREAK